MAPLVDRRTVLQGLGAAAALGGLGRADAAGAPARPHVLFISIDDLNDWVGVLGGHEQAQTPYLDRLASNALSFTNAHCNAPACNPSRSATLTGIRPSTSGLYENDQSMRAALPDAKTIPQVFRRNGYRSIGCGKVFHIGDPASWDDYHPDPCEWPANGGSAVPRQQPANGIPGSRNFDWGPSRTGRDGKHSDDRVADWVVKQLGKKWDQPTFLAAGIFRPHLPWYVPQDWFDLFPLDRIVLPTVKPDDLDDVPEAGRRMARIADHERIVGSDAWAAAVQGYLASIAFADHELGRILDALAASGHAADTIVVLWSDHGWSLGTKFHWKKFALWEECTRIPLVVKVPWLTKAGSTCSRPVSLVDVAPTLSELCGLPVRDEWEGQSLVPLLREPGASWDRPALITHGRNNHAVRSERYRYIRYADGGEELYDHEADPHEWTNLARSDRHQEIRAQHAAWLPSTNAAMAPKGVEACGADRPGDAD